MKKFDTHDYTITADTDVVFEDIYLDAVEPPVTFHGEQLTEAGAAELAAETAREARHCNLVPGRKSRSHSGEISRKVAFRLPENVHELAHRFAHDHSISLSELGRRAITEHLDRHQAD
jgi:predicted HicB family RNase H-like nuclease